MVSVSGSSSRIRQEDVKVHILPALGSSAWVQVQDMLIHSEVTGLSRCICESSPVSPRNTPSLVETQCLLLKYELPISLTQTHLPSELVLFIPDYE